MSDTWSDIQALKSKQSSLREKLARRKKERQDVVAEVIGGATAMSSNVNIKLEPVAGLTGTASSASIIATVASSAQLQPKDEPRPIEPIKLAPEFLALVERQLVSQLVDISLSLPIDLNVVAMAAAKALEKEVPLHAVEDFVQKCAAQTLLSLKSIPDPKTGLDRLFIDSVDHARLAAMYELADVSKETEKPSRKRKADRDSTDDTAPKVTKKDLTKSENTIESLLSTQSAKERESKKLSEEILQLLSRPTAKEQSIIEKFKSQGGAQVREFCTSGTREECQRNNPGALNCDKLHFKKIRQKHTDESLGDCSFLNTCFHMDTCKFVHYQIDYPPQQMKAKPDPVKRAITEGSTTLYPQQWVQCDMRLFNMSVLGKFAVIMADPPWDIHMELPYGTMSDDEMRNLNIPVLQDDGYIFLWVTGRAMELGRECLTRWGYERVDELIWVKTNQLQRIIRTGRTGHWLNHGKEHCLVGAKGNLKLTNRGLDCDVIVAEVRATSHKPDEVYGIIERLSPGTRKIELFGRPHNVQPNWITLGNQLDGVKLLDPEVVRAFKKFYPDGNCMGPSQPQQG